MHRPVWKCSHQQELTSLNNRSKFKAVYSCQEGLVGYTLKHLCRQRKWRSCDIYERQIKYALKRSIHRIREHAACWYNNKIIKRSRSSLIIIYYGFQLFISTFWANISTINSSPSDLLASINPSITSSEIYRLINPPARNLLYTFTNCIMNLFY